MPPADQTDAILYGDLRDSGSAAAAAGGRLVTPRIKKLSSNFKRLGLDRWVAGINGFCGCPSWIAAGDFPSASWTEAPDQEADVANVAFYHELIATLRSESAAAGLGPAIVWQQQPRQRRAGEILRRGFEVDGRSLAATVNAEAMEAAIRIYSKNPKLDLEADPERWQLVVDPAGSRWAACYSGAEPLAAILCGD